MKATYLADKSALARLKMPSVHARLGPLITQGQVATCALVDLEILYSARNQSDLRRIRARRRGYERVPVDDVVLDHAMDIQEALAGEGRHRLPIADIIIAAAASQAALTVLHYDSDFDAIAAVTGQPTEWVVPRGTVR